METKKTKDDIFTLVKDNNKEINICVGNFAIAPRKFKTFQEAQDYLNSKPYEVFINLIYLALYEENKSHETATEKTKKSSKEPAKK